MKTAVFATLLLTGMAAPVFAAENARYHLVVDTVRNCSVIEGRVSTGKTAIGEKDGYASKEAAMKALEEVAKDKVTCKGVVG